MSPVVHRLLIVLGVMVASAPVTAQDTHKIPRVGWLNPGDRETSANAREPFLRGMRDLGLVEGRDFAFEPRYWGSDHKALVRAIDELVRMNVAVIVTAGTPQVRA